MSHADNAVGALHPCEKSKRPHDVRPQDGKWAVAQRAAERKAVLPDMEADPLAAEAGLPDLNLKRLTGGLQLFLRVLQPPRSVV